ncbi:putative mfs monocarboxylate protein [Neofusicoccum parvum]|uniref:Mfs monocarboxylate protein n=1 Tax=Neofusicoccum parvum TaxID=310453 RepID=A0ACB5S275_9PEZI|nr:putative mfs monocarboxylate protein [Neofusicoccum parvum]
MSETMEKLSFPSGPPSSGNENKVELGQAEAGSMPDQQGKNETTGELPADGPSGMPIVPEGGMRGWMAVAGCWCALFFTFGYVNSFGVYEAYYLQTFLRDTSPSAVAWIGSIQACSQFSATVISGPITDRYGPSVIVLPFSCTYIAAMLLTSACKKYYQFLLCQGILLGISSGLIYAPAVAVVGHYFHRKRPMVLAIASTGSTLGGIIFPVMLTRLLNHSSLGFGWTQRCVAFLASSLALVSCATVRPGIPPRKGAWLLPEAFLNPAYTLQVAGLFLISWGLWTPFFYLSTYGLRHGMDASLATYLVAVINGGSFVGRMGGGAAALALGQFNLVAAASLASGVLVLCWLCIASTGGLVALAALYGATSGMVIALMIATLGIVAPRPNQIGTYIGMGSGIVGIAALTGTPITGALISRYGGYDQAIIFSGVCIIGGGFFFAAARFYYAPKKLFV